MLETGKPTNFKTPTRYTTPGKYISQTLHCKLQYNRYHMTHRFSFRSVAVPNSQEGRHDGAHHQTEQFVELQTPLRSAVVVTPLR